MEKKGRTPIEDVSFERKSKKKRPLLRKDDYDKANILQKQFCSLYQEPDGEVPFFAERTNARI